MKYCYLNQLLHQIRINPRNRVYYDIENKLTHERIETINRYREIRNEFPFIGSHLVMNLRVKLKTYKL